MGRQANDGRGRLGGRALGTKNKPQPTVNDWINGLLDKKRGAIETALMTGDRSILSALLIVSALNRLTDALTPDAGAGSQERGPDPPDAVEVVLR